MIDILHGIFMIMVTIALFVICILPKLGTNISKEYYDEILSLAMIVCKAAEQIAKIKNWTGEQKKQYVYDILKKHKLPFTDEEIEAIIENTVYLITQEQKGTKEVHE